MNPLSLGYKRLYDGFNYRLRSFAAERFADHCRPTSITCLLTERCNARCVHCDIWKSRGREETPTPQQWDSVITDLRRWLGPVQLTFSGGEALMQPFAVDLVKNAVDLGLIVEVLSNGYWNNQQRIERLALANPWRITVSLDAIGPTHNLIRGRTDFFERTEKSLHTLQRIRREMNLSFRIRLKTVVMQQNIEEIHETAHYAAANSFEVFYQPIEQNYNTEDDPHWYEASKNWPTKIGQAVGVVAKLISLKRDGLPIANSYAQLEAMGRYFLKPASYRLATQSHSAHENKSLCGALVNLEIGADGTVFSCVRMGAIGNIKDQAIREIWESRPKWWREGCCRKS